MEEFLKAHQYTIAAFGVLATFSAVVVSLVAPFIATRASRTRIRASASINVIHHSSLTGKVRPKYLVVSIRNMGVLPVHIPAGFFHWKLLFGRQLYEVIPLDLAAGDPWAPQRKYSVEIEPRSSYLFFLSDICGFREYSKKDFVGASVWSRLRSHFLSALVLTDE